MSKPIISGNVTFVDLSDSRKLEAYITSNLPTTQIYNQNNQTYTPDWSTTNLRLSADIYLDSKEVTDNANTSIVWYKKIGTQSPIQVGTGVNLTINSNQLLSGVGTITYICEATYNDTQINPPTAHAETVFIRIDTGLNGSNGKDGTSVTILGSYSTLSELQTAHPIGNAGDAYIVDGDLYVWATDNTRWENVGNIQGPKGDQGESAKAIILNATAQVFKVDKDDVLSPEIITVTAHTFNTTVNSWSYSTDGGKTFLSTAPSGVSINQNIVTISGSSLTSNSLVIRASDGTYGDTITIYKVFDGYNGTPAPIAFLTNENITFGANENGQIKTTSFTTDVVAYIGTTKVLPTIGEIKNLPSGMTFKSSNVLANTLTLTFDIANNSTFGSESSNRGTINIPITSPVNTSLILNWSKVNAGASGIDGEPGEDAYTVVLTNASHTFAGDVANAIEGSTSTQIIAYKGSEPQDVTVVSVNGMNASTNNTATGIVGLNFKCSTLNDISPTITFTCTSDFKNASGLIPIVLSVDGVTFTKMFTYSIAFKGEPGEVGPSGVGINSVTVTYGVSTSASTQPTAWQNSIPAVSDGSYLWTRTVTDYTDDSIPDTVTLTYARQGVKGDTGSQGSSITVSSVQYQAGTSATTAPTSTWSNSVVEVAEGSYLWTKTTFSDNKVAYGVARQGIDGEKGDAGKGVSSIVEQYYQSTSATAQSGGSWSTTVPTWADGKYIWTRSVITYTDSTTHTTSPVCVTGQKGSIGGTGVGVSSVDVWYYQSTSATSLSGGSWSTTAPTWSDGKYVWTKTIVTYTNNTTDETNAVCITGQKGSAGVGIKSVTEYYLATASSSGVTTSTSGWTTAIQTITLDKKYLWNYEVITYTDNTTSTTTPIVIGVFGNTGDTGKGIKSVTEYYLATTSSSGITTSTSGWTTTMQSLTATNKYLWNYELITYTDNTTATINPVIIGVYGDKGNDGVGIASTTVTYGVSDSSSTQPTSWQATIPTVAEGKYLWTRTVIDYTDTAKADTVSYTYAKQGTKGDQGSAGSSVTVTSIQYQEGTSATTAPTGTWSNSVVSVADGKYLWTKTVFSDGKTAYGVAKQGSIGATGKGIKSVVEYYLATSSSSGVTTSTTGWTTTMQTLTSTNKYLWNYELITYTDDSKATINPIIIGVYGDKGNQGDKGSDAVTFQVYAPNGYLLTKDLESLTLQIFAYEGSIAITSGATYQWAQYDEGAWENISGATTQTLTITKADVVKSKSYKCTMTYKSKQYTDTATVQDKTDTYDSLLQVITKYSPTNRLYWVLYSAVYSEEGEIDSLLGSVSATAPTSPTTGQYWYKIDETNYTVTLMKYSGTAWAETTDKQELVYDWSLLNDANKIMSLGSQGKVKIITSSDFSKTCTVQCNIRGSESIPISYSNQILIDPSDPIVSSAEPTNPTHGQLWIKTGTNSLYTLLVWDASLEKWVVSETDSRVKVHISKPSSYEIGDVWVVGSDYEPTIYINGVAQTTKHLVGTMLKAQYSSQSYKDSDWVEALNYKKDINDLKENLNMYNQFFSADEDGLVMQAKDKNGVISEFKTKLTHTELGFYQGENKVAHINNNQLNISKAEITNGMTITGTTPVLEIGNFIIIQESNGSLSIGSKS